MRRNNSHCLRSHLHDLTHCSPETTKSKVLLLLWLSLHCRSKCFLLWCNGRLGFSFQCWCRLFSFSLQGPEAQDLTVFVALVQSFELVNEGGGAVSFEAFISKKRSIINTCLCQFTSLIGLIDMEYSPFLTGSYSYICKLHPHSCKSQRWFPFEVDVF